MLLDYQNTFYSKFPNEGYSFCASVLPHTYLVVATPHPPAPCDTKPNTDFIWVKEYMRSITHVYRCTLIQYLRLSKHLGNRHNIGVDGKRAGGGDRGYGGVSVVITTRNTEEPI